MRLLLIRHGQTTSNVRFLLDTGLPGADLTGLGREQAAALPEALAREGIGAIYVSTLVRTQQTAAPLARALGLDTVVREGIREVLAGDLEMRGDEESVRTYIETVAAWTAGDLGRRMPGGESGREVLGRFDEVVAEAATSRRPTVALVSHGSATRFWAVARSHNLDAGFAAANLLSNTAMVVLEGDPGSGWRAVSWAGAAIGGPALVDLEGRPPGIR